jgi:hypothetical protein
VFYICIGTVVKFILDSFINNKQIKKTHNMEKNIFTSKETTREQYLKFKDYIKSDADKDHADYVAYYILKHRIVGEERDKYLEDEVRQRCWKMLVSGRWGSGGEMVERYAVPMFKDAVIRRYNKFVETDD